MKTNRFLLIWFLSVLVMLNLNVLAQDDHEGEHQVENQGGSGSGGDHGHDDGEDAGGMTREIRKATNRVNTMERDTIMETARARL